MTQRLAAFYYSPAKLFAEKLAAPKNAGSFALGGSVMRLALALFLAAMSFVGAVGATEPTPIPLDRIWGHSLQKTKSLRSLDPLSHDLPYNGKPETKSKYWQIIQALQDLDQPIHRTSFVVAGDPWDALNAANAVLCGQSNPDTQFDVNDALSVVFFSRMGGLYVVLEEVTKSDEGIEIVYRQHRHRTADLTEHLAIIPIGSMKEGVKAITITQLPTKNDGKAFDHLPKVADDSLVCGPSQFQISAGSPP